MSASSKKKLRNEQQAAKLTERQLAEQKEAKQLKLYTTIFVIVLVALLVIAIGFGVTSAISNSGTRERNTVAMTVGGHEISNAEMNYYFIDNINNYFSGEGSYFASLGFVDTSLPLDEQTNPLTGENWADYMMEYATQSVKTNYALNDAAKAEGYTLSEETAASVDTVISNLELYGSMYGYSDTDQYLKAMYGNGADMDSYRRYVEMSMLAQEYYNNYSNTLSYDAADLKAENDANFSKYSSFTYNYYYLSASKFLEGGTTDEEGTTTYTDEETAASIKAAEETAKALIEGITTAEELDAAISELSINAEAETPVKSTLYEDNLYANIASDEVAQWLGDKARKEGDITYIANEVESTDPETGETTTNISGYYVLYFHGTSDNTFALKNVRHILCAFEGGTYDSTTGTNTYSDEEKAAAKAAAEELLAQWESGEATEESFAALANEHSDDGDGTTGGLYENVYPGQMVAAFDSWCFEEGRQVAETGIVETEYGYHVMYFSGDSETTYRDHMIEEELRTTAVSDWYNGLLEAATVTEGDISYVNTDVVLNSGY